MKLSTSNNNSEKELFQSLSKSYSEILPQNIETLLLIVWLYKKVENGYIAEEFEEKDFEDTFDEVKEFLQIEKDKNVELLSQKISNHFYQTEQVGNKYRIHLTVYAKSFCKLLINEIQPELLKLELYHTFQRTLPLKEEDLLNIETFKYWFDKHFQSASEEIYRHIEQLHNDVSEKISELTTLLKTNKDNPKEQIESYGKIFEILAQRVEGIISALHYKDETLKKVKSVKENFTTSKETYDRYQHYNKKNTTLETEISTRKELLSLYDGNNSDSFFNWAVNQKSALSVEQETILMAFKDIYTKQVTTEKCKRFSLNPQSLINSFEKTENGVWAILGDLSEYFPLIKKQIFNDKNKLEQALANNKEQIETEIKQYKTEQAEIKNLNDALIKIGLNQELIDIYINRKQIENFQINNLLTEENIQFIEQNFSKFSQIEKLQKNVDTLIDKKNNSSIIQSKLDTNKEILDEILENIAELKNEITSPIEVENQDLQSISDDELLTKRKEYKTQIKKIEKDSNTTKTTRDTQKGKYDSANSQTNSLKTAKERAAENFTAAKQKFENETFLNFDTQLQMGELSEETVNSAKTTFEDSQRQYEQQYAIVANSFEESKAETKSPELYDNEGNSNFSYQTLENVLCGKIGLDGVTDKLGELNETLKKFAEFQMKILTDVFGEVEKQFRMYEKTITNLNFFFREQKISDIFQFNVDFEPRKDINIDWIDKMRERSKVHKDGVDLFTLPENLPSEENTPENLIKNIASTFYRNAKADVSQLLNPKFYFTLKVSMKDESGNTNSGRKYKT